MPTSWSTSEASRPRSTTPSTRAAHDHVVDASTSGDVAGDDPHFWLDPTRLAQVADGRGEAGGRGRPGAPPRLPAQPGGAAPRPERASTGAFRRGLADCRIDTIVASHDAFGYLGRRYGLRVVGINGLSPDAEPSPAHIRQLQDLIAEDGITTVFSERLASRELADSLAGDLALRTAVLDPVEGLSDATADQDYLSLMRRNLSTLREANQCSMSQTSRAASATAPWSSAAARSCVASTSPSSPGEVVAVLGANGSGQVDAGAHHARPGRRPTRARSELFGTPLGEFRDWQRVGFVPQRVSAASGVPASVREVVASGRLSRPPAVPARSAARTVRPIEAAIEAVGLAGQARDGVSTLSGGQQQRVLIARAMAGVPDLLVLDEPTAGVDAPSQQAFADALRSHRRPRRHDRARRPRARPARRAGGPRTGDARRPGGVRRTADRRLHRRGGAAATTTTATCAGPGASTPPPSSHRWTRPRSGGQER